MNAEKLYLSLPIIAQNLACTLYGLNIHRTRYNAQFYRFLSKVEQRTYWSQDQIYGFRDRRLADFISHCALTVPYYRKRFREWGIDPSSIKRVEDLEKFPLTTKEEIQNNYQEMLSEAIPLRKSTIAHTSGTTGGGLRFLVTSDSYLEQWSVWWRYRRWHKLNIGTKCGYFGGRSVVPLRQKAPPYWRYDYVGNQILFSGYHMSPETLRHYVEELRRKKPPWLNGYPSLLALLATYIIETGSDLGYQPRWITTVAENLMPHQHMIIENAFGVRPLQHYGMAEGAANMSECDFGKLHVDEDFSAIEFLPTAERGVYRVIGTAFSNPALPFLRYDVQDKVTLKSEKCTCGRGGRIVAKIDGRQEDYVILRSGARIGRMDHIFKDLVNIREAQLYQQKPGEVIFRVVRGNNYNEQDEKLLRLEAIKRLGPDTKIIFEYMDSLTRGPTGKLRFVLSEISEGKICYSQDKMRIE